MSTPVVLKNGDVNGALCCFSFSPVENPDPREFKRLQYTAQLTADKIDGGRATLAAKAASANWALQDK